LGQGKPCGHAGVPAEWRRTSRRQNASSTTPNTATVREHLLDPVKTLMIPQLISEGNTQYGMQSFDQSIMKHYRDGMISYETALQSVTNPDEFKLRLRGIENASDSRGWDSFDTSSRK